MNAGSLLFEPLVPPPLVWAGLALSLALIALAAWRGLVGWGLRALAAAVLIAALAGPSLQQEQRRPRPDILAVIVDESASQTLGARRAQTEAALAALTRSAEARGLELHITRVGDGADNRGTLAMGALTQTLAELPAGRIGAVVLLSDGQVHDLEAAPPLPAPLHLLTTGQSGDWDRRITVTTAPAFGILGETQEIGLRVEDIGAAPGADRAQLSISVDGAPPSLHDVPVGRDLVLPITLSHGGQNVIQLNTPVLEGELTDRNNAAVIAMSGVRDRLRVLLVTGVPHPGTRTWRNLLKSDSAVDLVHFTILRPPEKQDGVPVNELSLIAFPTQELFIEKVDEFDLIIFDRYMLRGILPGAYLGSVRDYVLGGGAVLVAAGPDFASVRSLARTALGDVLPGLPTSRLIEAPYTPEVTELGARHPVTRGLEDFAPPEGWGRWMRQAEVSAERGNVVMQGAEGAPLLLLDRVGEGRVALLASDHAWLWSRGYEGGGPQLELLRRLAHWMMKEPELEEEALTASAEAGQMVITRRTLETGARSVTVTAPDGTETLVPLTEAAPGLYRAEHPAGAMGLYRLADENQEAVIAVGPAAPREFEMPIASGAVLEPVVSASGGGVLPLAEGTPELRPVRPGRTAQGRGWIGYVERGAYAVERLRVTPIAPPWLMLVLAAGFAALGWLIEGRRQAR